ncbi:hypothetical protein, partial [Salmonella enterica]|uniref:hypothetical protein n=1 Tax=Salmonella enterica TaxID=28901 RepID=UPI0020C2B769
YFGCSAILLDVPKNEPTIGIVGIDLYNTLRCDRVYGARPCKVDRANVLVVLVTVWKARKSVGKEGKRI